MREILFRGKVVNSNEWRTGYFYTAVQGCVAIIGDGVDGYQVKPESVGQYTGLKDRKGAEIFEGDIVRGCREYFGSHSTSPRALVIYKAGMFLLSFGESVEECTAVEDVEFLGAWHDSVEVIGNIHDEPKLLEVSS